MNNTLEHTNIHVTAIRESDFDDLVSMVGNLLQEIMDKINYQAFKFDPAGTKTRAKELISQNKYWVFMAKEMGQQQNIGFISLYESYALYSEGAYGTIPELYVLPKYRSQKVGQVLIQKAVNFGREKSWSRLEVTTPPLPQFDKTLEFYESNGFAISGGRKLKIDI